MARAVIITGGNLGDVKNCLREAQRLINAQAGVVMRCSHMYESKAWGFDAEHYFFNQVLVVDTDLGPEELLDVTRRIEEELGRDRAAEQREKERSGSPYSSRVIDIDILFYDDRSIDTPSLKIPHPMIPCREFVLTPLCEVLPRMVHPALGKTMEELHEELKQKTA